MTTMPPTTTKIMGTKRILRGNGMSADNVYFWANWVLVGALIIGVISTYAIVVSGNIRDQALKREVATQGTIAAQANERAANLEKEAADARLGQEKLRERAANLEKEAAKVKEHTAELEKETETLREKNISLEQAILPRFLEQAVTGQALKPFANVEVKIISLPNLEPSNTAGQIRFMLQQVAGWKPFSGSLTTHVSFFDGVVVHASMSQDARAAAKALVSVLNNNGIDARTGYPILELGTNGILVIVGAKPLPKQLQPKPEDLPAATTGPRMGGNILDE